MPLHHHLHPGLRARIGVSRWDITPGLDVCAKNWGAARHWFAEGVHRPLTGTALCIAPISGDGAAMLLLSLELGWWRSRRDGDALRAAIIEQLALPDENVIVHLTHTHSGPVLDSDAPAEANPATARAYLAWLTESCVSGARAAISAAQPATMLFRHGHCALATERDFVDPNKPERHLTGFNPAATADDTLLTVRVIDDAGKTIATLVNYACHPTTLAWENKLISPDYPGAMREVVEAETGSAPCLFLLGACGEYAPAEQYSGDVALADRHGRELGHAALAALTPLSTGHSHLRYDGAVESGAPLAMWSASSAPASETIRATASEIELDLKPDLLTLAEIEAALARNPTGFEYERLQRKRRVRMSFTDTATSMEKIWLWRLGDALLCGVPFECYSALQTVLRAAFPTTPILVLNVANGILGYLPPQRLYDHDLYTVWQTPFARGSLERVIARAVEEAGRLLSAQQ